MQVPYRCSGQSLNLLIDSTGVRFLSYGEWRARKLGALRGFKWRKVYLAMDTATGDIRTVEFTSSRQGDNLILPELLSQIPFGADIETVTADGSSDTRRYHATILERGADPIIAIRRNGRAWKADCTAATSRNNLLQSTRRLGRSICKKWASYHVRRRLEA